MFHRTESKNSNRVKITFKQEKARDFRETQAHLEAEAEIFSLVIIVTY